MRKELLALLFSSSCWAACPLWTYPENHKLDAEVNNICDNILNPTINNETVQSETVKSLTVSTMTVSSFTATSLTASSVSGFPRLMQLPVFSNVTTDTTTIFAAFAKSNSSATITPISASSIIEVTFTGSVLNNTVATSNNFTFFRDSTNLGAASFGMQEIDQAVSSEWACLSMNFWDAPGDTNAHTYFVEFMTSGGTLHMGGTGGGSKVLILKEWGK